MAGGWRLGELEAFEFDVNGAEVGEVVVSLLSEPGFGTSAEDFRETDGHFGRDAAFAVDEFGESGVSDTEGGGFSDGQAERFDTLAQDEAAGMWGFFIGMVCSPSVQYFPGMCSAVAPSMIVQIVDIKGISFGETKGHSPVSPDIDSRVLRAPVLHMGLLNFPHISTVGEW